MRNQKTRDTVKLLLNLLMVLVFVATLSYTQASKNAEILEVFANTEGLVETVALLQENIHSAKEDEFAEAVAALQEGINQAKSLLAETYVCETGASIYPQSQWASQAAHTALRNAINVSQSVLDISQGNINGYIPLSVAAGGLHTLAINGDGTVLSWGRNEFGQLGNASNTDRNNPVNVRNITDIVAVRAGVTHSIALQNDGSVWAWGQNNVGQLGIGNTGNRNEPVRVSILTDIVSIDSGSQNNIALKNDGTVWIWGSMGGSTPVRVEELSNVIAVAAGRSHYVVLLSDGTVWAWGRNLEGQLGNGNNENSDIPVKVQDISNIISISAGSPGLFGQHTIALRADGRVFAWGRNNLRQLGNNSTTNSNIPIEVSGLTNIIAIDAGNAHNVALRSDGTILSWGDNSRGQIGNNAVTTLGISPPVQVRASQTSMLPFTDAVAIAAGEEHTVARRADGTIWVWGNNSHGQIGNGTTVNRPVPTSTGHSFIRQNAHTVTVTRIGNGAAVSNPSSAEVGTTVSITAIASHNNRFVRWDVLRGGITIAQLTNPMQTFIMPDNQVWIRAVFEEVDAPTPHAITVTPSGSPFSTVTRSHTSAPAGTEITITATPVTGYRFVRWEVWGGGITIAEPANPIQTFIMPDNPVGIWGIFEEFTGPISHNVNTNVNIAGSGTVERSHTSAPAGTQVTIEAIPNEGYRFVRWEVVSGGIALSSTTTRISTFTMPNNTVTVRAIFESRQNFGERTFNLSGEMSSTLPAGDSGRSSVLSVDVTSLPSDATVTKISINVGSSSGTIIPSSLRVTSSSRPGHNMDVSWTGQQNTPIGNDRLDFWNYLANATWTLSWYGTNTSLFPESRSFSNVTLTIEYEYMIP